MHGWMEWKVFLLVQLTKKQEKENVFWINGFYQAIFVMIIYHKTAHQSWGVEFKKYLSKSIIAPTLCFQLRSCLPSVNVCAAAGCRDRFVFGCYYKSAVRSSESGSGFLLKNTLGFTYLIQSQSLVSIVYCKKPGT